MSNWQKALERAFKDPSKAFTMEDYDNEVARGNVAGAEVWSGFGEAVITASNEDVWGGYAASTIQPEPVGGSGYTPTLKCADGNDTSDGTGARSIEMHWVDANDGLEYAETIATNGSSVTAQASTVDFINDLHVITAGSGGVAAGNIDVLNVSTVMNRILAAGNQQMSTMKKVPAGKRLLIRGWHCEGTAAVGAEKECSVRIRASVHHAIGGGQTLTPGVYHFKDTGRVKDSPMPFKLFKPPLVIPPLGVVKTSGWATGGITINSGWRGILETVPS
jgi:hypothetical protein